MFGNRNSGPASQTRRIGKLERDFVYEVVTTVCPRVARLHRDEIVGSNAKVEAWLELIPTFGRIEFDVVERAIRRLKGAELADAAARLTHLNEQANTWRRKREEARKADEANRAERAATKAEDSGSVKLGDALSDAEKAALQATVAA